LAQANEGSNQGRGEGWKALTPRTSLQFRGSSRALCYAQDRFGARKCKGKGR